MESYNDVGTKDSIEDTLRSLWDHQKRAVEKQAALSQANSQDKSFALLMDPGTGKSATAIHIWRNAANKNRHIPRTIVFCPPIVVPNWKTEFKLNSKLPGNQLTLLTGSGARRERIFFKDAYYPVNEYAQAPPELRRRSQVFVTNYETLLMKPLFEAFMNWEPEFLIFDESHELKNASAKRSRFAATLANRAGRGFDLTPQKLILTGSPVLKDAMDLFQQFLILDGGQTLGHNFYGFQGRYFRDHNAGMPKHKYFPDWRMRTMERDGYDAAGELSKLLERKAIRAKKSECMDLPPFVQVTLKVPMGPEQRRLYDEMKKDFVTYLDDKACVATLAMTKALRLQQLASGYLKATDGEEIELQDAPKQGELARLLTELTPFSKVLVWATWRNNYKQIREVCEQLKIKYVEVHGEVSEKERNDAVFRLNHDPDVRVFIGHPGSGGVGINLVAASYSIFYSRTFSLKHYIQAEARNYRGGSEIHEKITRYDLVSENSIEEIILEKLANKIELSESLLKELATDLKEQHT